jgi:hypothetical protein
MDKSTPAIDYLDRPAPCAVSPEERARNGQYVRNGPCLHLITAKCILGREATALG